MAAVKSCRIAAGYGEAHADVAPSGKFIKASLESENG
jgi:hypothetical protein